uniref:Uncharacterized protein n=1 Tax=viral metagenome TaxID=1070528 RepID=A0A6C0H5X1_9ZZZZ
MDSENEIEKLKEKNNDLEKRLFELLKMVVKLDKKTDSKIESINNLIINNNNDLFEKINNQKQELFPFYNNDFNYSYNPLFYDINETELKLKKIHTRERYQNSQLNNIDGSYYLIVGKCKMFLVYKYDELLLNFITSTFKKINKIIFNLSEIDEYLDLYHINTKYEGIQINNKEEIYKFFGELIKGKSIKIKMHIQADTMKNIDLFEYLATINNYNKIEIELFDNGVIDASVYSCLLKLKKNCEKYNIPIESNFGI